MRARPIEKGTRVKITRTCSERRLFLATGREAKTIDGFFGYTLARALGKYAHELHAACAMGNHHHTDVTDVEGNRPNFKNSVHSNLARGLNARRGRFGSVWSGGGSCDTAQPSDDEAFMDLVYTEVNPVEAGLVKWARLWPGFTTHGWKFGETRTFKRPDWYYDPENPDNPEFITITRVRPKIYVHLDDEELFALLMAKVRQREVEIHARMKRQKRRFAGLKRLAKSTWSDSASSRREQFTVAPRIVASSSDALMRELARIHAWEREYADAREDCLAGGDPEFPLGTYYLRLHAGVRVKQQAPP